jgi:hypothetical protein
VKGLVVIQESVFMKLGQTNGERGDDQAIKQANGRRGGGHSARERVAQYRSETG